MTNISLLAQIAGFIVCLSGILCLLFGVLKNRPTAINAGKWAIIVGLSVLVGGKLAARPSHPIAVPPAVTLPSERTDLKTVPFAVEDQP